jgi:hypothetical protein
MKPRNENEMTLSKIVAKNYSKNDTNEIIIGKNKIISKFIFLYAVIFVIFNFKMFFVLVSFLLWCNVYGLLYFRTFSLR